MSITQWLQGVVKIVSLISVFAPSSVSAQSLACSVTPHWKVWSVTQGSSDEELSLAIETPGARGTVRQMSVSISLGSTLHVTQHGVLTLLDDPTRIPVPRAGWTFAVHVQEDERTRTAKVSMQAWCDGRIRGYDEAVLPIQITLDRT